MVLVISWKKKPHLHEFAIFFTVIYSLPFLTNLTVEEHFLKFLTSGTQTIVLSFP